MSQIVVTVWRKRFCNYGVTLAHGLYFATRAFQTVGGVSSIPTGSSTTWTQQELGVLLSGFETHDAGDLEKCVGRNTELFVSTGAVQSHACLEDPTLREARRSTSAFRHIIICIPHKCS